VTDALFLMEHFVTEYQNLYGYREMTYNLHLQLHLPAQVALFGPLFKNSAFGFEGLTLDFSVNFYKI
jgi:hypothetical protein